MRRRRCRRHLACMSNPPSFPDLVVKTPVIALEADGDFNSKGELLTRLSNSTPVQIGDLWFHMELIQVDDNGDAVIRRSSQYRRGDDSARRPSWRDGDRGNVYVPVLFPHER